MVRLECDSPSVVRSVLQETYLYVFVLTYTILYYNLYFCPATPFKKAYNKIKQGIDTLISCIGLHIYLLSNPSNTMFIVMYIIMLHKLATFYT